MEKNNRQNNQIKDTKSHSDSTGEGEITVLTWRLPGDALAHVQGYVGDILQEGYEIVDGSTLESPEPGHGLLRAYLPPKEAPGKKQMLEDLAKTLTRQGVLAGPGTLTQSTMANPNWWEVVKDRFPTLEMGSFVFFPPWDKGKVPADPKKHLIELEPGQAFGTGHHPTTRLCLQAMDKLSSKQTRPKNLGNPRHVFDLGCGSGILALAAAKLWDTEVVATDNDPNALELTRHNVEKNNLSHRVQVVPTAQCKDLTFDFVIANIRLHVLESLAPSFESWVRPGGIAILSGILLGEKQNLIDTWARRAPSFNLLFTLEEKEGHPDTELAREVTTPDTWICFVMQKKTPSTKVPTEPSP